MQSTNEEIKALKEKNAQLQEMLDEVLAKENQIVKIVSEPIVDEGKTFYRVDSNGKHSLVTFSKPFMFKDEKAKLDIGTEAVVIGNSIMSVIPKKAEEKKKKTDFALIGWDEIGGLKSQVARIRESIEMPLNNEKLAKEFGLEPVKGMLLYGEPGCGKTLIAKAIASTVLKTKNADEDAFVYVKGAELLSKFVGETERQIGRIFNRCREYYKKTNKRAVLFIDEAEALLPSRGSRKSSDVETTIVPTFLSEMDGFEDGSPFVLLSTNEPSKIDSAILRDGRIDIKVGIDRPTQEDCIDIFHIHLKKVKCFNDITKLSSFAAELLFLEINKNQISGALVQNVVKQATKVALSRYLKDKKCSPGVIEEDLKASITELK